MRLVAQAPSPDLALLLALALVAFQRRPPFTSFPFACLLLCAELGDETAK